MIRYLVFLLAAATCSNPGQGVKGRVLWLEGNQMPGFDNSARPAPQGVVRDIFFYEPVKSADVKRVDGFYADIPTKLVGKTSSDETGQFSINLPAGEYSVFTKEPDGLFANLMDGAGRLNVIEVKKDEFTEVEIKITYKAAF